jgi:hypothetical protein
MLAGVIRLRTEGVAYPRLARAHGYLDGYMRALLDLGVVEQSELLRIIAAERAALDGPATAELATDATAAA